jgi:D-sedoheptulose 7-phosphate isomerase
MKKITDYVSLYLEETSTISKLLVSDSIAKIISLVIDTKQSQGRIFFAGVGGSAANASHAVNDFRKIAGIESHSLTENVSELTARINDDGWDTSLVETLRVFKPKEHDVLFVLSVGGGSQKTSLNLVRVMEFAKESKMKICSIVSRNGGEAKNLSDICVLVPVVSEDRITAHAEGFQAVIWHCIANGVSK